MTTWARNVNDKAVDVTTVDPTTIFHPEVAAQFVVVPDGTLTGAVYANGSWTNPTPVTPPTPPVVYSKLTPIQYYNAFTVAEAIAIKTSSDPVVLEIWYRLQVAMTASGNDPIIDPNSTPVQAGLEYLSTTATPYILPSRIPQICAGVAQ